MYPRQVIPLQVGTLSVLGLQSGTLISIEKSTNIEFDPLLVYKELVPPEVRSVGVYLHGAMHVYVHYNYLAAGVPLEIMETVYMHVLVLHTPYI